MKKSNYVRLMKSMHLIKKLLKIIVIFFLICSTFSTVTPKEYTKQTNPLWNSNTNLEITKTNLSYDYIIVTDASLASSLEFFKNWKEFLGYSVKIVNTSWISNSYDGRDTAEKIKNFLKSTDELWNIKYTLLVGDNDIIPWRYVYAPEKNKKSIPSDFYYADLSSNWDANNNNVFAELEEGEIPDFTAETYIGRIPFNDAEIIQNICQKIIKFEQNNESWKRKTLLLGAITNFENELGMGNPKTDTAHLMNLMKNDILLPENRVTTTMYETEGREPSEYTSDYPLTAENVISSWKSGYGLVSWASHGTPTESSRKWWYEDKNLNNVPDYDELKNDSFISRQSIFSLNNDKPSIVFSCSCSNADPENPENLGKNLLQHGAVGFIGSTDLSHYVHGWDEKNDGGTMSIEYYFFKNFLSKEQSFGESLYNSLYHCWSNEDIFAINQNMFLFTIYGDPSISFSSYQELKPPEVPSKPVGETFIKPDVSYDFSTTIKHSEGENVYCIWDWGDGTISDLMGPYKSGESIEVSHSWVRSGNFRVKVKGIGSIGDESVWSEPLLLHVSGPVIRIEDISAGLLKVNSVIKNYGDETAKNINCDITIQGGTIVLGRVSEELITSLEPGEKQTIISKSIIGFGFPSVVLVEAGISNGSNDKKVQSANIFLSFIRIA